MWYFTTLSLVNLIYGSLASAVVVLLSFEVAAIILLIPPAIRKNEAILAVACAFVFLGTWIDKGMGMISGGFVPNPLHQVNEYMPTIPEVIIAIGVWGRGIVTAPTS